MDIGKRIRLVRDNTSQVDFAKQHNIAQRTLSGYEKGNRSPSADFLRSLAYKCNIDIHWVLTGDGSQYIHDRALTSQTTSSLDAKKLLLTFQALDQITVQNSIGLTIEQKAQLATKLYTNLTSVDGPDILTLIQDLTELTDLN